VSSGTTRLSTAIRTGAVVRAYSLGFRKSLLRVIPRTGERTKRWCVAVRVALDYVILTETETSAGAISDSPQSIRNHSTARLFSQNGT
jgi:hypothetical protein